MKKSVIGFFAILFLVLTLSFISSAIMHNSEQIIVRVDDIDDSLQDVVGSGKISGTHVYASGTDIYVGGHDVSQIWVSVQDGEMTLLQALSSTHKLCPNPSMPTTYSPTSSLSVSHTAMEIALSSGKTLQKAINDREFCGVVNGGWSVPYYGTCTAECGGGYMTVVKYCNRPAPANGGSYCTPDTYVERWCSDWFLFFCTDYDYGNVQWHTGFTDGLFYEYINQEDDDYNGANRCNMQACGSTESGGPSSEDTVEEEDPWVPEETPLPLTNWPPAEDDETEGDSPPGAGPGELEGVDDTLELDETPIEDTGIVVTWTYNDDGTTTMTTTYPNGETTSTTYGVPDDGGY
jgi:hypothetical protein